MKQYYFIFGLHPALSAAELVNIFKIDRFDYKIIEIGDDFIIIRTKNEVPDDILDKFAGSVKFGEIIDSTKNGWPSLDDLLSLELFQSDIASKISFGFSLYPEIKARERSKNLFRLGLDLKKKLKDLGKSSRLVSSKETNLSSVVVEKNRLLTETGVEIIFLQKGNELYWGKTKEVQDFSAWSKRDYDRPGRDAKSGMLPPKLARMMLNLTDGAGGILLDPFCGSGTVLQEALLMGFKDVKGLDLSPRAVFNTKQNMNWLQKKYKLKTKAVVVKECDVRNCGSILKPRSINTIVTEPDLGNPNISPKYAGEEKERLEKLYASAYKQFVKILKSSGKIVMIWPVFFSKTYLDLEGIIGGLGFKKISPLAGSLKNIYNLNHRGNIEYARPGQKVLREITIWQKT